MARHAVLNGKNLVINVIMLEDLTQWSPPPNCTIMQTDVGDINDTWDGTNFIPPSVQPLPLPQLTPDQIVNMEITDRSLVRALILALNDGSFVPGGNLANGQLRAIFKAKL